MQKEVQSYRAKQRAETQWKKRKEKFSFCNSWEHDIIRNRSNRSYGSGKQKLFVTADLNFTTDTLMERERIC